MKQKLIDILKAVGLTLGGFLIGSLLVQCLQWLAKLANIDSAYILLALLFSVVVYANYKLMNLYK